MEMASNCDVTNSTPNTNDHHMTLNHNSPHENFLRTPLVTLQCSISKAKHRPTVAKKERHI